MQKLSLQGKFLFAYFVYLSHKLTPIPDHNQ